MNNKKKNFKNNKFLTFPEILQWCQKDGISTVLRELEKQQKWMEWKEASLWENPLSRRKAKEMSLQNIKLKGVIKDLRNKK